VKYAAFFLSLSLFRQKESSKIYHSESITRTQADTETSLPSSSALGDVNRSVAIFLVSFLFLLDKM